MQARGTALFGYARALTLNSADAQDLVQEGLIRAIRSRTFGGLDPAALESFVRTCMIRVYLDSVRRRRLWQRAAAQLHDGAEARMDPDVGVRVDLVRALSGLSPRQRAVVVLTYYDDLPAPAVAGRLGCSEGNVKRHLADARRRLKESGILADGSLIRE